MISDGGMDNKTVFDLTFDQEVTFKESFFPSLSLSNLFSQIGGALGLWLGIGVLQITEYGSFLANLLKITPKKN